jgi:hypothetical protein
MIPWDEGNLNPPETILASVELSSPVASIEISLPTDYKYFRILHQGFSSDTTGVSTNYLVARFRRGGTIITTGTYAWAAIYCSGAAAVNYWNNTTFNNCIALTSSAFPYNTVQFYGSLMVDPGDSNNVPAIRSDTLNGTIQHFGNGYVGTAARAESVIILPITGNITRGRYWVYGIR